MGIEEGEGKCFSHWVKLRPINLLTVSSSPRQDQGQITTLGLAGLGFPSFLMEDYSHCLRE